MLNSTPPEIILDLVLSSVMCLFKKRSLNKKACDKKNVFHNLWSCYCITITFPTKWFVSTGLQLDIIPLIYYVSAQFSSMAREFLGDQSILTLEASRSYTEGIPRTSEQSEAENSTWQHTLCTRDRHLCPRRDSNPQSPQARGHRPTP